MNDPRFPVIGLTEMRDYIAIGRARLAGRKSRQNQYFTGYENIKKQQTLLFRRPIDVVPVLQHDQGCINF